MSSSVNREIHERGVNVVTFLDTLLQPQELAQSDATGSPRNHLRSYAVCDVYDPTVSIHVATVDLRLVGGDVTVGDRGIGLEKDKEE